MMLSWVSWPTSFTAATRPGAFMSMCFPPPAGTTKPLLAVMVASSYGTELSLLELVERAQRAVGGDDVGDAPAGRRLDHGQHHALGLTGIDEGHRAHRLVALD